jgi:hypothetical protein
VNRAGRSLRFLGLAALAALAGCPGSPAGDGAELLRPGQRWRFVQRGLPDCEQVYLVTGVSAAGVDYEVQARVGGEDVGQPVAMRFSRDPAPAWEAAPGEEALLTVSGVGLPCRVRELAEGARVWTAGLEQPEFPGVLKAVEAGRVTLELVEILPP